MSTKNNPGSYDCYAKLGSDEPYFVIRAKDPVGATVVRIWAEIRSLFDKDNPKIKEALQCSQEMRYWRKKHCD